MATTTTNYGLTKPSYGDNADISVINSNMDKIDAKMKEIENKAGSGGGSGSSVNYSTEEQVIGTWIDGKPLYQKTIVVNSISTNNASHSLGLELSDIDEIFLVSDATNLHKDSDPHAIWAIPYSHPNTINVVALFFNINTNTIELRIGSANYNSAISGYITVRYTKTTD